RGPRAWTRRDLGRGERARTSTVSPARGDRQRNGRARKTAAAKGRARRVRPLPTSGRRLVRELLAVLVERPLQRERHVALERRPVREAEERRRQVVADPAHALPRPPRLVLPLG